MWNVRWQWLWATVVKKRPHKTEAVYGIAAYTLSWYAQIWLRKIMMATEKFLCCVVSFFSKLKTRGVKTAVQYKNYQTIGSLNFRPLPKSSFIVLTSNRENRVAKKHFFICRYYSPCFNVHKSLQHSILTKKAIHDSCFKTSRESIL